MKFIQIYSLKNDFKRIKMVQEASIDKNSNSGYKIENGLLFGTKEWFTAIDNGIIHKHTLKGSITRLFMSGQNDYPEFEIECSDGKSVWTRLGNDFEYKIGRKIELIYVEQKFKRPQNFTGGFAKCVIKINGVD